MFRRKAYDKLLEWKRNCNGAYAALLAASGRSLYYHSWTPKGKSHSYEVDFLLPDKAKIAAIEVKSSNINNHASIEKFVEKYSKVVSRRILFSQKDASHEGALELEPLYLAPAIISAIGKK